MGLSDGNRGYMVQKHFKRVMSILVVTSILLATANIETSVAVSSIKSKTSDDSSVNLYAGVSSEIEEQENDSEIICDENDPTIMIGYKGNKHEVRIPDTITTIKSFGEKEYMKFYIPSSVKLIKAKAAKRPNIGGITLDTKWVTCLEFESGNCTIEPKAFPDLDIVVIAPKNSDAWKYAFDYGNIATENDETRVIPQNTTGYPYFNQHFFVVNETVEPKWKSSNKKVLYVSGEDVGLLGMGKPGKATVTVKMNGRKYTSKISVKKRTMKNMTKFVLKNVVKKGMTRFEKIEAVYGWINLNHFYPFDYRQIANIVHSSGYNTAKYILTTGTGICGNYAMAFKYYMDKLNIPCKWVSSAKKEHAWNIIKIGKYWYQIDPTQNIFLKNKTKHGAYDEKNYPKCKSKKYNKLKEVFLYDETGRVYIKHCRITKTGKRVFATK